MDLADIHEQVGQFVKDSRSLLHLVKTEEFTIVFVKADERSKLKVKKFIDDCDIPNVRLWLKQQKLTQRDYTRLPVRELRGIAAKYRIPDYQWMDRFELIIELEDYHERTARESKQDACGHEE